MLKVLGVEDRAKFDNAAATLKKIYDDEVAEQKKNEIVEPQGPKRPSSAYLCFARANREQIKLDYPNIAVTEIMKKQGILWQALLDKSEFEQQAKILKDQYDVEMKQWLLENPNFKANKAVSAKGTKKAKTGSLCICL